MSLRTFENDKPQTVNTSFILDLESLILIRWSFLQTFRENSLKISLRIPRFSLADNSPDGDYDYYKHVSCSFHKIFGF